MTTVFRSSGGGLTSIPNFVLCNARITNIKRSGAMTDTVQVYVSGSTSRSALRALEVDFMDFVRTQPAWYEASGCNMLVSDIRNDGGVGINFTVAFRTNFQLGWDDERRSELLLKLRVG